jgi:hypothetical protein
VPHAFDDERMLVDEPRPLGSAFGAVAECRESRLVADEVRKDPRLAWPSTDLDVDSVGRDERSDTFDQPRLQSSRLEPRDASRVVGKPNQTPEFLFAQTLHW